jgi:ankyrin repeat protein
MVQALNDEPSYLFLAVEKGHVEVVRALLEVGGRELVMMTRNDGVSCLWISAANGDLEVVKALLEAGARELVMLTENNGVSCLFISAQRGHVEVVKALLEVGGRELAMLTTDDGTSCLMVSAVVLACKYVLRCSRVSQSPNSGYASSGTLAFSLRRMPPRPATDDPSTRPGSSAALRPAHSHRMA